MRTYHDSLKVNMFERGFVWRKFDWHVDHVGGVKEEPYLDIILCSKANCLRWQMMHSKSLKH